MGLNEPLTRGELTAHFERVAHIPGFEPTPGFVDPAVSLIFMGLGNPPTVTLNEAITSPYWNV